MARIKIDGDDSIWDLLGEWLRRYNRDYHDNITKKQITDWDLTKFVKCGNDIYKYLDDPDLYDNLQVFDGAIWAINKLKQLGHECVVVSAGVHPGKRRLLYKLGIISNDRELFIAKDKDSVRGDYLIDDGIHNIKECTTTGILFDAFHNKQYFHPYRAMNWYEAVGIVCAVEAWKNRRLENED